MGKTILRNLVNFIGEPSTTLMCKKYIKNHQYLWADGTEILIDVSTWLHLLSHGNLFYFAEPLSHFRMHVDNAQSDFSTLVKGTISWAHLIEKAEVEHCFLETIGDFHSALSRLVQMGLRYYRQEEKLKTLPEDIRMEFEQILGQAFLRLSKIKDAEVAE